MRAIINLKFIFYKNHNLLIYSKFVISIIKVIKVDNEFLLFDEFSNNNDDVENINNLISPFR